MLRTFIQSIKKIWTTENALLIFFENGYFALVFFCNLIALSVPSPFFLWRFELKTFISNSFSPQVIKIWDMRDLCCVQTIPARSLLPGPHQISSLYFNSKSHCIFVGTNQVRLFFTLMIRKRMSGIAYDRLVSAVNNGSFKQSDVSWVGAHSPSSFSFS